MPTDAEINFGSVYRDLKRRDKAELVDIIIDGGTIYPTRGALMKMSKETLISQFILDH